MKLQTHWFSGSGQSIPAWLYLLAPLSVLFKCLSALRRWLFKVGVFQSTKVDASVIIVGNITVGGNGKTPLVIGLAQFLKSQGHRVGILSRGYGGAQKRFPHAITYSCLAAVVGDEPKLMFDRLGGDVVIDPNRARGAAFLNQQCGCNVILCDDGLQHYALHRDFEIVVMDKRELGNGYLLPMGPLREGRWRLKGIDALVFNSYTSAKFDDVANYTMHFELSCWVNVVSKERKSLDEFQHYLAAYFGKVSAIAGIGDPQRFFDSVDGLRITTQSQIGFPDHYQYTKSDLPNGMVLMTEKDAVKCAKFANMDCWYLEIKAQLPSDLLEEVHRVVAVKQNSSTSMKAV